VKFVILSEIRPSIFFLSPAVPYGGDARLFATDDTANA